VRIAEAHGEAILGKIDRREPETLRRGDREREADARIGTASVSPRARDTKEEEMSPACLQSRAFASGIVSFHFQRWAGLPPG